jgi:hypothetical protein
VWSGKSIEKQDFSELTGGLYFLKVDNRTIKLVKQWEEWQKIKMCKQYCPAAGATLG